MENEYKQYIEPRHRYFTVSGCNSIRQDFLHKHIANKSANAGRNINFSFGNMVLLWFHKRKIEKKAFPEIKLSLFHSILVNIFGNDVPLWLPDLDESDWVKMAIVVKNQKLKSRVFKRIIENG